LLAPAKTPEPIIKRLTEATRAVMDEPDVRARLEKVGLEAGYLGPNDLHARMAQEMPMWKEIVERAGIRKE